MGVVMRYCLGPNTLGRMKGCPIHLSFHSCVPCSKMAIIFFMYSWVLGGGIPIAPGNILCNNTSRATDRQSLCLPSLNAQINSSKAGVWVQILPILSLYTGVVYRLLQPSIFEINSRTLMAMMLWAPDVLWFLLSAYRQSSMNLTSISSLV